MRSARLHRANTDSLDRSWDHYNGYNVAFRPARMTPESLTLRTLSGGTRQKVNAVAAFLFSPDLYVLDEPTTGLDPVCSGILKRRILEERVAARTIVFTSHILSEIDELADDVVFLHEGRVQFAGGVLQLKHETGQATTERAIADLMVRERAA